MADHTVHSAGPVTPMGGFPARTPHPSGGEAQHRPAPRNPATDEVRMASGASPRRLLRERILARARALLGLGEPSSVPEFAEALDDESSAELLGRLLSAMNQLLALAQPPLPVAAARQLQSQALAEGAAETLELLGVAAEANGIADLVVELLASFRHRLAMLDAVDSHGS